MRQIHIKNAYIVTMNQQYQVYKSGEILLNGDRIIAVGSRVNPILVNLNAEIIDAKGKIVMPGLINTHVHTSQQLGRGLGDDVNLLTWLHKRIWPYESNLTEEDSYISTLLCNLELIKSGVTAFAEPGGQFVSSMAKAVSESGIRGMLAKSAMDNGKGLPASWQRTLQQEIETQEENIKKFHNTADERIKVWLGIRTIFNASDNFIIRSKELADKYDVGVHMHVAEIKEEVEFVRETRGSTTVKHLENLGVLDKNFLAVHSVWLTNEEVEIFKNRQVKVSHNPAAAMKVLGFAKVPRMLREGVCVTIGTDGAPCNNRMNMIDEMWLTSLIHKGWRLDPTIVKAEEILKMGTINGARAILDEENLGSLEAGKKADLIIINPNSVDMLPMHDGVANLISSMHSTNVESMICNGKWIMKNRKVLTIDEEAIIEEAKERAESICKRAGIVLPERFPIA
ncbi:amidohydrolase [Clostridium sediminicola]|uniref:amidohydrolase n=1 Tax=Clostridium sediminicola TaxID=3114879 RepID=UPI0031F1F917